MSVKRVGLLVALLVCGIGSALQAWAQTGRLSPTRIPRSAMRFARKGGRSGKVTKNTTYLHSKPASWPSRCTVPARRSCRRMLLVATREDSISRPPATSSSNSICATHTPPETLPLTSGAATPFRTVIPRRFRGRSGSSRNGTRRRRHEDGAAVHPALLSLPARIASHAGQTGASSRRAARSLSGDAI